MTLVSRLAVRRLVKLGGLTSAAALAITGLGVGTATAAPLAGGALDCAASLASISRVPGYTVPDGKMVKDRPQDIPTAAELLDLQETLDQRLEGLDFDPAKVDIKDPIEIHVYVHVIHKDGTVAGGNIPRTYIRQQMKVLNHAFRGHGDAAPSVRTPFKFVLGGPDGETQTGVDRTQNADWYENAHVTETELEMKEATYVGSGDDLNIWTTNLISVGLLGYAYYPDVVDSNKPWRDGLVVDPQTFPGGSAEPYNEGDTATHEIGHYMGLAHTFDNGCQTPGDLVDDTPYEAEPYFGKCADGPRDSCTGDPGNDPIENFMDYSDDDCMDSFTLDQRSRALEMWYAFRDGK